MLTALADFFGANGFMPHGHCFLWTPALLWSYVVADSLIAASYYSIPVALWYFVRKRHDLPFSWIFVMFGVFVMACGTTHIFAIWNIWTPNYWADASLKLLTAMASVITAILLWPLIPRALAIPSHELLQRTNLELQNEIARRDQAEAELREINAVLARRSLQLEAANRELEAFSYSVSHDLRAPLRHIEAFSRLLLDEQNEAAVPRTEAAAHYLDAIVHSISKMGKLVDDLLAFSRTGRIELHEQPVDLNPLVASVRDECAPQTENPSRPPVEWRVGSLPTVCGDASLLHVVFINLLGNAVKFSSQRRPPVIQIEAIPSEGDEAIVVVRDNGAGFDPQFQAKLFGVFQRLHRDDEFEGNGIGLATVQRIVERLGGRVWAESELDQGAAFFVALKRA